MNLPVHYADDIVNFTVHYAVMGLWSGKGSAVLKLNHTLEIEQLTSITVSWGCQACIMFGVLVMS